MKVSPDLAHFARPQVSRFTCSCARHGEYEWVEFGQEKACPYCGKELEPKVIHQEVKVDKSNN